MSDQPYTINANGYIDDPNFREPAFAVELAKAASAPVAELPTIHVEPEDDGVGANLTVDVYETNDEIVITAPLAGVADPSDIDIDVSHDVVTIRGTRRQSTGIKENDYLLQECYWGRFSRSIVLPSEVDSEEVVASFSRNGILTVHLPKRESAKVKKVDVRFS